MLYASARKHCPPRGPCQSRLKAADHPKCRACPCPSCVRVRVTIVRGATQLTRRSADQWERGCRAGNAPGPGGGGLPRHHSANAGRIAMAKLRTRMHGKCRKCHHQKRGVHGPCLLHARRYKQQRIAIHSRPRPVPFCAARGLCSVVLVPQAPAGGLLLWASHPAHGIRASEVRPSPFSYLYTSSVR